MEEQVYQYVFDKCQCNATSTRKNRFIAFITIGYSHTATGNTEQLARHNLAYKLCHKAHVQQIISSNFFIG